MKYMTKVFTVVSVSEIVLTKGFTVKNTKKYGYFLSRKCGFFSKFFSKCAFFHAINVFRFMF